MKNMLRVLKRMGEAGIMTLLLPFSASTYHDVTNRKNDFLILSHNQEVPKDSLPFILPTFQSIPQKEVTVDKPSRDMRAETNFYSSIEELKSVTTLPLYTFDSDSIRSRYAGAFVTSFLKDGKVWLVRQVYSNDQSEELTIDTIPIISRPVPVSPALVSKSLGEQNLYTHDDDYLWVNPEYTTETPNPGIIQKYDIGFCIMWIEKDVLYVINNMQNSSSFGPGVLLKLLIKLYEEPDDNPDSVCL
ncbi:MAG: hypothetical protein WA110_10340 [Anaerolineaceae bacterium]